MTPVPEIQPLPQTHRKFIFIASLLVFIIAVPSFVFYAVGYRFDFSGDTRSIKSVGGMYVSVDAVKTDIYIDNRPVSDMRIFQSAAYIQNLVQGVHQVHVQGEHLQTWVKQLPVFSHFVTETASFNMPETSQVRLVAQYQTETGVPVLFEAATSTPLQHASSSQIFFIATSTATTSYDTNPEYAYVEALFASSTEDQLLRAQHKNILSESFVFSHDLRHATSMLATTTKVYRNTRLFEHGDEVYIQWIGAPDAIPYYYCVRYDTASTTAALYGTHVENAVVAQVFSAYAEDDTAITETQMQNERWCRDEIKIDRLNQAVVWFDYFPSSRDLILMHLSDGLYVVEVDDRAWQNTQMLYQGTDIQVVKDGDRIFVYDKGYYLEVFTELQE